MIAGLEAEGVAAAFNINIKKELRLIMNMTQKALVQTSFAKVRPIAETAAALFYRRLFELDPTLRPLFKGDLEEQGRKLMDMLAMAVKALDRPEALLPALAALGRRHAGYGVNDHDYETVGEALLWTLEQGLGPSFTPEVREAWSTLYRLVADTMRMAGNDMVAKGTPAVA
jgi:hemoglobin-like flavoprotein